MSRRVFRVVATYGAFGFYFLMGVVLAEPIFGPQMRNNPVALFFDLLHAALIYSLLFLMGYLMRYLSRRSGATETPPE